MSLNEFIVEEAALSWFGELGYGEPHQSRTFATLLPRLPSGEIAQSSS